MSDSIDVIKQSGIGIFGKYTRLHKKQKQISDDLLDNSSLKPKRKSLTSWEIVQQVSTATPDKVTWPIGTAVIVLGDNTTDISHIRQHMSGPVSGTWSGVANWLGSAWNWIDGTLGLVSALDRLLNDQNPYQTENKLRATVEIVSSVQCIALTFVTIASIGSLGGPAFAFSALVDVISLSKDVFDADKKTTFEGWLKESLRQEQHYKKRIMELQKEQKDLMKDREKLNEKFEKDKEQLTIPLGKLLKKLKKEQLEKNKKELGEAFQEKMKQLKKQLIIPLTEFNNELEILDKWIKDKEDELRAEWDRGFFSTDRSEGPFKKFDRELQDLKIARRQLISAYENTKLVRENNWVNERMDTKEALLAERIHEMEENQEKVHNQIVLRYTVHKDKAYKDDLSGFSVVENSINQVNSEYPTVSPISFTDLEGSREALEKKLRTKEELLKEADEEIQAACNNERNKKIFDLTCKVLCFTGALLLTLAPFFPPLFVPGVVLMAAVPVIKLTWANRHRIANAACAVGRGVKKAATSMFNFFSGSVKKKVVENTNEDQHAPLLSASVTPSNG